MKEDLRIARNPSSESGLRDYAYATKKLFIGVSK